MRNINQGIYICLAAVLGLSSGCSENPQHVVPTADGLKGKVLCGYQGWYRTPTDGSGLGWEHYETYDEKFKPGHCGIDFWPDMSELDDDEKFKTEFVHKDGSPAYVFSSQNEKTVKRHFKWMKEYGIDGIFLQRFAHDVLEGGHHQWKLLQPSNNKMAEHVQKGAQAYGRTFAIMYDLSGIRKGEMSMVMDDWRGLNDRQDFLHDPHYLHEKGKPLVAIWGVGFKNRPYTLDEVATFIDFLKNDPKYGGCTVMLGVPTYWRKPHEGADTTDDPKLLEVIKSADVLMPWNVGRFGGSKTALKRGETYVKPDQEWCNQNGVHYLPLIFPGFSWANRYAEKSAKFNKIPREGGLFLWSQAVAAKRAGADTVYIAMFDEMDESTQIFKVTNDPPLGKSKFLTYEPHEPDYYLRLSGAIGKMLRNDIPATDELPKDF